jgi:hypothetical protein
VTDSNQATTALDDAAHLSQLRADFPAFRIWREITGDRTVYVARRRRAGTRPHTLVTRNLHELHTALASSSANAHSSQAAPATQELVDEKRRAAGTPPAQMPDEASHP